MSVLSPIPMMTCSRCVGRPRRGCCNSTSTGWSTCATGCRGWGGCRWAGRLAGPGRDPADRGDLVLRGRAECIPRRRPPLAGAAGFCERRPIRRPCRWSGCVGPGCGRLRCLRCDRARLRPVRGSGERRPVPDVGAGGGGAQRVPVSGVRTGPGPVGGGGEDRRSRAMAGGARGAGAVHRRPVMRRRAPARVPARK